MPAKDVNKIAPIALRALGSLPAGIKVNVRYDDETGKCNVSMQLISSSGIRTGAYFEGHSPTQILSAPITKGKWDQFGDRWMFRKDTGTYANDGLLYCEFEGIYNWYFFDEAGYMVTGWKKIDGSWHYFRPSGIMSRNQWGNINDKWYYFSYIGDAEKGLVEIEEKHYYFEGEPPYMRTNEEIFIGGWEYQADGNGVCRQAGVDDYTYEIWTVNTDASFYYLHWRDKGSLRVGDEVRVIIPKKTAIDGDGEQCVQFISNDIIYWVVEAYLNEPEGARQTSIALVMALLVIARNLLIMAGMM